MESLVFDGLIFICHSNEVSGLPLWCSYLKKALDVNFNAVISLFLYLNSDLPSQFTSHERCLTVDCVDDTLDVEALTQRLKEQLKPAQKNVLFLDSATFLVKRFGVSRTVNLLMNLRSSGYLSIVAPLSSELTMECKKLAFYAFMTLYIELDSDTGKLFCRSAKRKKDGLVSEKLQFYEIASDTFMLRTTAYAPPTAIHLIERQAEDQASNLAYSPFTTLPFDVGLNLKELERRAKANVQLPYTSAQSEKGLVNINMSSGKRIRVGGQIVYTPDENDDLDDSDPDDDLMI